MNADLSHRVGRVADLFYLQGIIMQAKAKIAHEVDRAESFEELSESTQKVIIEAEKEAERRHRP